VAAEPGRYSNTCGTPGRWNAWSISDAGLSRHLKDLPCNRAVGTPGKGASNGQVNMVQERCDRGRSIRVVSMCKPRQRPPGAKHGRSGLATGPVGEPDRGDGEPNCPKCGHRGQSRRGTGQIVPQHSGCRFMIYGAPRAIAGVANFGDRRA